MLLRKRVTFVADVKLYESRLSPSRVAFVKVAVNLNELFWAVTRRIP